MQKKILVSLIGLFLTVCPSYANYHPKDVEGWDKVKWGMKAEEIEDIFKGQIHKPTGSAKGEDWYVSWEIAAINLGECAAEVKFLMDSKTDELNKVMLIVHEAKKKDYDFLHEQLIKKYGQPTHPNKKFGVGKDNQYSKWVFPSTLIMLSIITVTKQDVRITYEANRGSNNR